jgi:hypothetical protein
MSRRCLPAVASSARHIKGRARVVPVIVRPTFWQGTPLLSELQALPTDAEPISKWQNKDEAFANVTDGIRRVVQEFADGRAPKIVNYSPSIHPSGFAEVNSFCLGFLIGPLTFLPHFTGKQNEETNNLLFCRVHAKAFATALEIAFDVDAPVDVGYWFKNTFQALEIAYPRQHVALCFKLGYLLVSYVILRGMYPVREDCPQHMANQAEQLLREATSSVGIDVRYLEDLISACKSQQIGEDKDKYIKGIGGETAEKIATYLETSRLGEQKNAKTGGFGFLRNLF